MMASDGPDESTIGGLDIILNDFQNKTEFMGAVKQNNKNLNRKTTEAE
jgi:hypothetical protein